MLILLAVWEVVNTHPAGRRIALRRYAGALAAIVVVTVAVLWVFYSFRYTARPGPLKLNPTLAEYTTPLGGFTAAVIGGVAHARLLPESYLIGLVDVKRMAEFYPTYIFGKVYAHGKWWYFPAVILIKTTLGMLVLVALALFAMFTGKLKHGREVAYILIPWLVYLIVAMAAGMNIGARHILPLYAFAAIFAAGGVVALSSGSRGWMWVCSALICAHVISSLTVFPNYMAYANVAWGGPRNVHNLLSDANVDWAQQLLQVKRWRDRNPNDECWFAYFAHPEVDPNVYGIHCHAMPTIDTGWVGGADIIAPAIHGTLLISAGDLSGCEWPSGLLNPYRMFQKRNPEEVIDYGVFVYRGDFAVPEAASLSRAQRASALLEDHRTDEAFALAREAVAIDPNSVIAQTALGDAAAALGQKDEAHTAWTAAISNAHALEPDAQESFIPQLEKKLRKIEQ
jgi:hypothetical protein